MSLPRRFEGLRPESKAAKSPPVLGKTIRVHLAFSVLLGLIRTGAFAEEAAAEAPPPVAIVISVKDQRLALIREGAPVKNYPISTSKFGLGDSYGSYKTPLGELRVCDKIGDGLPIGSVIKHRNATGEILPVNAPGRDPIVTRILWLDGREARNDNARSRGIYIHGTVEESKVGDPVSYGCIRMRSRDVAELFAATPVGTPVQIIEEKLPRIRKTAPAAATPEVVIVKNAPAQSRSSTLAVAPKPPEKAEPTRILFGEKPTDSKPTRTGSDVASQVPAGAVLLAEGTEEPTGGADSAKRIRVSMKQSILFSGLPEVAEGPDKRTAAARPARRR